MSIAAKCDCGNPFTYCTGGSVCQKSKQPKFFREFVSENYCTPEEINRLKAFLFALRHKDSDMVLIERIIARYDHLIN